MQPRVKVHFMLQSPPPEWKGLEGIASEEKLK